MKQIIRKNNLFAAGMGSLAIASLLTGCGLGTIAATDSQSTAGVTLAGRVHGGEQAVTGSTIRLYAVGATGYGSNATQLLTGAAITTDSTGSWNISGRYTCPSASSQVYLTATGGNPGLGGATNNAAIKLAAALGSCGNLGSSTFIDINEVTTVAAAFALGQYFGTTFAVGQNAANTGGDSFGAPNTTQALAGITNAMATTARLANLVDGSAVTSQTLTSSLGNITATPETSKINLIANILASCVNSDGGSTSTCPTLFSSVVPSGFTTPSNTLEAAVYMSINPTSNTATAGSATSNSQTNLATLCNLVSPTPPFAGQSCTNSSGVMTLYDWTLGVTYSAGTSATQTLINGANGLAIDSNGNVWIINLNTGATATESMTGFSPTGVPIANPFNSGATSPASMAAASPRNIAIDLNNNVIATSSSGSAYAFVYNQSTATGSTFSVGGQGYGISIDGNNNVFISHNSASSNTFSFDEYSNGTLATTNQTRFLFDSSSTVNQFATISTGGYLYLSRGSGNSTQLLQASAFNTSSCTSLPCTTATATFTPITTGAILNPYNIAAEKNGGVWVADNGANTVTYITGTTGTSYGSTNSFTTPRYVAVDGANIAWFTDRGTGGNAVSEITTAGIILSPVLNTSSTTAPGYAGFNHSNLSTTNGIAIDPSGNIWVPSGNVTSTSAADNSIFEIVGAAVPAVTPISLALKNGTVGARP